MKRSPLRRLSKKRAAEMRIYAKMRVAFLAAHPACRRCFAASTEVHHAKGRAGPLLLDVRYWIALCHDCHVFLTEHPSEAYKSGLSVRRVS